ncbi:MAG: DUF501 domain-containing protein [Candidatus Riflebacteria bacterium]|nr:DUF501 domain-containing protein [Candidatus Riflebacteria bacterium]
MNPSTISEFNLTVKLLGRTPRTPFTIKTRCPDNSPQTLIADPVFWEDGIWKPFPPFIWLICPRLKALVGVVEQNGYVKKYSERLKTDAAFYELYLEGHKQMIEVRLNLARRIYPGILPEHIETILAETSVAGSKDLTGVKCLHSHVAQELAYHNNPIGAEVLKMVGNCSRYDVCGSIYLDKEE